MDGRACVLIVDDEERNRTLIRVTLRDQYRTLEVENGTAAPELLQREPVDLVLLDVMMPGMTGFDVVKARRRGSRRARAGARSRRGRSRFPDQARHQGGMSRAGGI